MEYDQVRLAATEIKLYSTRHVNIREAADKEYLKNVEILNEGPVYQEEMTSVQYLLYCAGDTVTVYGYPKMSGRQLTCHARLLCYVNEDRHDLYQLL